MGSLEKEIEKKFCEYAIKEGCYPVKFEDPSRRGALDRMILCPGGLVLFIEFKRPGEKPRDEQLEYMNGLIKLGFFAVWTDNFDDAVQHLHIAQAMHSSNGRF